MAICSVKMKMIRYETIVITSIFGMLIGLRPSEACDLKSLQECFTPVTGMDFYTHFQSISDMTEYCQAQLGAISCSKRILKECIRLDELQIFDIVVEGKQSLLTELCTQGSEINKKYMDSSECLQKTSDIIKQCEKKFEMSQKMIEKDIADGKTKSFFSCCAFEWMRKCKVDAVQEICGVEASTFIDNIANTLGGEVLNMCSKEIQSCHGRLYGGVAGSPETSLSSWIFLSLILWIIR